MKSTEICGIKVSLKTSKARETLARVLEQIGERRPRDLEKIQRRVLEVRSRIPQCDEGSYIIAEWVEDARRRQPRTLSTTDQIYGRIFLSEQSRHLASILAHELGHACTDPDDRRRRTADPGDREDGWERELAADWYAYKWGFGRSIGQLRRHRDPGHHPPGPGATFKAEADGYRYRYCITRNFVIHLIEVVPLSAQSPE